MKNTKKQNLVDGLDQQNPNLEGTDKLIAEETHNPNAESFGCAQDKLRRSTYFISDLHLDPSRPHLFKLFHKFIEKIRPDADALYILGDLFEFWIGDDIIDLPIGKPYLPVINQLKSLSDSGVKLFFIQGNRDFLIGDTFMRRIGGTLLPDETVIDLYGTPVLIMHGDTLCTDDKGYQWMRKLFRLRLVQKIYLSMSPEKRAKKAGQVRNKTSKSVKKKSSMIMDVNQHAVENALKGWGVCFDSAQQPCFDRVHPERSRGAQQPCFDGVHPERSRRAQHLSFLIHGHTHRPAEHEFFIENKRCKRIVLGDWGDEWSYLEWKSISEYTLFFQ